MRDMEKLRQRIIGKLNEPAVEMKGDIISFYDLYRGKKWKRQSQYFLKAIKIMQR